MATPCFSPSSHTSLQAGKSCSACPVDAVTLLLTDPGCSEKGNEACSGLADLAEIGSRTVLIPNKLPPGVAQLHNPVRASAG